MKQIKNIALAIFLIAGVSHAAQATISETSNYKRSDGDGATTAFTYSFPCLSTSDLKVYLVNDDDTAELQTYGSTYTATLGTDYLGGTINFSSTPAASQDVLSVCDPAISQTTAIPRGGRLDERALERALDRLTLISAKQRQQIDRALKLRVYDPLNTSSFDGLYIAVESGRAGKLLVWNDDGDGIEAGLDQSDFEDDISNISTNVAAAAASAVAASSSASSASTYASNASTYATNASTYATNAANSATDALTYASAAADSAASLALTWEGNWTTATAYTVSNIVFSSGSSYIATADHTSGASTEPGIGGSWASVWDLMAQQGSSGAGTGDMLNADNLQYLSSASTARANLGVAIGTNVQAWDAALDVISNGVTPAADTAIYFVSSTAADTFGFTSTGRSLVDDTSVSAMRTTLGLGTVSTLASDTDGTLAANSDSRVATQKAAKTYVDTAVAAAAGGDWVLIEAQAASAASSVDFDNFTEASCAALRFVFAGVTSSANNADFLLRTSTNNGSSYDTTGYDGAAVFATGIGGASPTTTTDDFAGTFGGVTTGIPLVPNDLDAIAGEHVDGEITIYDPSDSANTKTIMGSTRWLANADYGGAQIYGYRTDTADIDAVRFILSSGNISGNFYMYCLKNS